jgi:hypothetical protein
VDAPTARTLWKHVETLNAVTYFSPECREAPGQLGLKGFWMAYFAFRSAPFGAVSPAVVEATFFNFHPSRVRRALPDAWTFTSPDQALAARAESAAAALRRLLPGGGADHLAVTVGPQLDAAVAHAGAAGRPLFAANRDVARPDDEVAALWQAAATLREHRGDGHVALLTGAGLDGCEVHVLLAAGEGLDASLFLASRGWSEDGWQAARDRLQRRGLLAGDGSLSAEGIGLRAGIERRTDELAIEPYRPLGDVGVEALIHTLAPATRLIAADISYPNPMGLPSVA